MPLLALTGGIAAGKSTISRMLQEHGALIVDADAIVREVQAPGSPVLDEIAEAFGREMIDPDGALDRCWSRCAPKTHRTSWSSPRRPQRLASSVS